MSIINEIAYDLGISQRDISYMIKSAPKRYKVYTIPKKSSNDLRIIAQPAKEVKIIQRWVIKNVLIDYPIHDAATAYIKGRNIKYNAEKHANNAYLLKLDFKNFFPSLKPNDFMLHTNKYKPGTYTQEDFEHLIRILFWKNGITDRLELSIGGPSSPMLSNTLMYDFDVKIWELCTKMNVVYTRYADDITLSTNEKYLLKNIQDNVVRICNEISYPRLTLNFDKTVHASKKHRRRITGLIITNSGDISLGRKRKRIISSEVYRFKCGLLNLDETLILKGHLGFALDIEPDFVSRLNKKYGRETITNIINFDQENK